ncbi:MAG: glycosyltransferase [Chryseolinea sp.]
MRILMMIPELTTGGAQRSFSQLANDLSVDHEISIVVFNRQSNVQYPINGNILSLDVIPGNGWLQKMYAFYLRVVRLKKIKRTIKPAVSISFLEGADYVNILSSEADRPIISIRGPKGGDMEIRGALGWIRKKILIPFLYRRAYKVIAVSSSIGRELVESFGLSAERVKVIGNYYDLVALRQQSEQDLPARYNSWLTGTVLVNVGRLHKGKNHSLLINTFARLLQTRDCKLVIVGDGPMRKELIDIARTNKLRVYSHWDDEFGNDYDIYFVGEQKNPLPFIRRTSLFVFTSSYEGFPNVLIEAMVCGTPILSSQCEGCAEVLSTTNELLQPGLIKAFAGIIVVDAPEEQVVDSWVTGIMRYLDSHELRDHYKKNGFLRVERYEKSKVLAEWIEQIQP